MIETKTVVMTQEQKLHHVQVMLAAMRVVTKQITSLHYQFCSLQDSASFVLVMNEASIANNLTEIETLYAIATNIVNQDK